MVVPNTSSIRSSFDAKLGVTVSSLLVQPKNASHLLVLGHGAGAPLDHIHMNSICDALALVGIATFRFNFPFMERGGGRTDNLPTCLETIGSAIAQGRKLLTSVLDDTTLDDTLRQTEAAPKLLLGGHSFGGRMASHFTATYNNTVDGLVYFSFPLHPSKKPAIKRADHLPEIMAPQLYLSGTRDSLAELNLLEPIVERLDNAKLVTLDTADHGFKILKRTRISQESVYDEAARALKTWTNNNYS